MSTSGLGHWVLPGCLLPNGSSHYSTVTTVRRTTLPMARPLIGISGRRWPATALGRNVPAAMNDLEFDLHFSDYPRSVALAGGLPVELTRDADAEEMVAHLDGLVLTGGADVEPEHYDQAPDEQPGCDSSPTVTPGRWHFFAPLATKEIPVLAICRGLQLVNVVLRRHACASTSNSKRALDIPSGTSTGTRQLTR